MTEKETENEHFLSVLVELKLFPNIRAIKESNLTNKEIHVENEIKKFIAGLPDYLSEVPNAEEIVRRILARTEDIENERLKKQYEEER